MQRTFWVGWLRLMSAATIALGIVAVAASHPAGQGPWLFLYDVLDWPIDGQPARFTEQAFALNAVLGGVMAGWGTLMYALSGGPIARDSGVRRMVLVGLVVWFVLDSGGSSAAGLPGNIVLNSVVLGLFALPLLALGRSETARPTGA